MADYISTLSGVQMDAALMDMAEHNSEAYAVGERNGNPVGADDVTYHNNARYYAQQAQSIVPASVTEAVRWDIAQTALTDANRLQARENIKATSHNYNLLDNSWFLVNSRGQSSYASSGYTVDRWLNSTSNLTTTISNGVVTLTNASGGGLAQLFSSGLKASMNGKTVTLSIKMTDDTIISVTGVYSSSSTNISVPLNADYSAYLQENRVIIYTSNTNKTISFKAVKLELGTFSTLANDTPPDYGEELTRCIYSTADPTDTYANNGFGRTNPNLLDNPWFTVNQKGVNGTITNGQYGLDRWMAGGGTVTMTTGGITLGTGNSYALQRPANKEIFNGKTVTMSVMTDDGVIESGTVVAQTGAAKAVRTANFELCIGYTAYGSFYFYNTSSSVKTVIAAKLELGSVSTLANDVAPDYGTELLKCQRYFIRIAPTAYTTLWSGVCINASTFAFNITTPVPMRYANPTISFTGTLDFVEQTTSGASLRSVTGLSAYAPVSNSNNIRVLATTASTLGSNNLACIYTYAYTPVIDVSCDL